MKRQLLLYIFIFFACQIVVGQVNQVWWSKDRVLHVNPVAGIDSVTFGQFVNADTFLIVIDRASRRIVYDTINEHVPGMVFHDTIYTTHTVYLEPGRRIGVFSVAKDRQVSFSQGNLQYVRNQDVWKFADQQYEYIGARNVKDGELANKIDLFGWSGDNTTAPFGVSTSANATDYAGEFVDWGMNEINGDAPNTWRTLSKDEWEYLINERKNASLLCGVANVAGINGLIILPDNWVLPEGLTFQSGFANGDGDLYFKKQQIFTEKQWLLLERAGAIFLPAAGIILPPNTIVAPSLGAHYQSSDRLGNDSNYWFGFRSSYYTIQGQEGCVLRSVRLVEDIENIVWYTKEALESKGNRISITSLSGFAYIHPEGREDTELNRYYQGKRINCVRLRVAESGVFTIAVVDRNNLNTIIYSQEVMLNYLPSEEVQTIYLSQTIHLQENQVLAFAQPSDKGKFYWTDSFGDITFCDNIGHQYCFRGKNKTLNIDAGYKCQKVSCDTIAKTLQLSMTEATLYVDETLQINTLSDNRIDGEINWTLSDSTMARIIDASIDRCRIIMSKADTLVLTASSVDYSNVTAQCRIIVRNKYKSGIFSVSADKQVLFSPGNLQYIQSNDTWQFADQQYEYIGARNVKDGELANKIDLFGWSGDNTTAPFGVSTSANATDYAGEFVDWGMNEINGDAPNTWRTLSKDEWEYLINERPNAQQLRTKGSVNGNGGVILLPDDWGCPTGCSITIVADEMNLLPDVNAYSLEEWRKMEDAGAILLPAAGMRRNKDLTIVQHENIFGGYWSCTIKDASNSYCYNFHVQPCEYVNYSNWIYGRSVRLVHDTIVSKPQPEYVDLGLSVKWATFNIGASAPEEYGDYFAWGETEPKAEYSWENYKWCDGTASNMIKYNKTDGLTTLDLDDDVAHVNWGGNWRMPTDAEFTELREKCTWTWTTQNGVNGYKVVGPNGNFIFLPAAGYMSGALYRVGSRCYFWSSSLNTSSLDNAYRMRFDLSSVNWRYNYRYYGFIIRPVCPYNLPFYLWR